MECSWGGRSVGAQWIEDSMGCLDVPRVVTRSRSRSGRVTVKVKVGQGQGQALVRYDWGRQRCKSEDRERIGRESEPVRELERKEKEGVAALYGKPVVMPPTSKLFLPHSLTTHY